MHCSCSCDELSPLVETTTDEGHDHDHDDHHENDSLPLSVLQFTSGLYFCTEDEGKLCLDVARFGNISGVAEVSYRTEESSAKSGFKFEHVAGTLVFNPGESMKQIEIAILQNVTFDSTLEFGVSLHKVKGAQLGRYLNHCRVKILDDDCFPTNKYSSHIKVDDYQGIPKLGLLWEFFKMLWNNDVIRRDSIKAVVCDQLKGVYFFFGIYLQMYLIDVVLNPSEGGDEDSRERELEGRLLLQGIHASARLLARVLEEVDDVEHETEEEGSMSILPSQLLVPGHRRRTAVVVGILYIVPFLVMHFVDQIKCFLCIPAEARKVLQTNLLRKFTHYKEEDRLKAQSSEITMVLIRDVREVIDNGFMKFFEIMRIVTKLGLAFFFVVLENWRATIPLAIYPVILLPFLICRQEKIMTVCEMQAIAEDEMVQHISESVVNFPLIRDFHLRPMTVDGFENSIDEYHRLEMATRSAVRTNWYCARWISTVIIGAMFMLGGFFVKSFGGPVSLGVFLATINVFKEVGTEVEEVYSECMEIQRSLTPLVKICKYLNCETDLDLRMRINRSRRHINKGKVSVQLHANEAKRDCQDGCVEVPSTGNSTAELAEVFEIGELVEVKRAGTWEEGIVTSIAPVKACVGELVFGQRDIRKVADLKKAVTTNSFDETPVSEQEIEDHFLIDKVAIEFEGLKADYEGKHVFHTPVNAQFPQGRLYAFVGPARQGKATIMKLLGQVILPSKESGAELGSLFVPPHLRVLHVAHGNFLLSKSFLENLLLGMPLRKAGGASRLERICEELEFANDFIRLLRQQLDEMKIRHKSIKAMSAAEVSTREPTRDARDFSADMAWSRALSHTDYFRLNLARAFVMNPEVMVIHRPTIGFDERFAEKVMTLFRRHVDERGLDMPVKMFKYRRPRTVFYTTSGRVGLDIPDEIYKVSGAGVCKTDKEEAFEHHKTSRSADSDFNQTNTVGSRQSDFRPRASLSSADGFMNVPGMQNQRSFS